MSYAAIGNAKPAMTTKTKNPRILLRPMANIVFPRHSEVPYHCRPVDLYGHDGLLPHNDPARVHRPLSMMKYDPVVKKQVLFLEATKGGKNK
ncbi:hypothetical protein N7497_004621 [Penicillium chrysogenum]|nr:hypothetical protein N7497_004621 [Penicillium chrysogenum]